MNIFVMFLLVYPAMIVTHELGHYLAAIWIGAKVKEVCFGAGCAIHSWMMSGTIFTVRLFPVSGYTMMKPEPENCRRRVERRKIFCRKPLGKRILVYTAGSAANILCGAAIKAVLIALPGIGFAYELRYTMHVFLMAGVWNLVPLPKTDGERIFELIVEGIFCSMKENKGSC